MHNLWLKAHRSVLSLTFENAEGRIASGTGFKVGNYLVTNNHVIQVSSARKIVLRGVLDDGYSNSLNLTFGHLEFKSMLVDGDPEGGWDFAILKIVHPDFNAIPALSLSESENITIGSQIALFGYQFEQPNLSMHIGYISSQYHKAGVHYLQLDSSVNHGNSGGPLIDADTGSVIGIVTRKATGLTQQFDDLMAAFRQNIVQLEALQRGPSRVTVAGINPVAAALTTQVQMERISKEISRSANVGIGYAYHIKKVKASLTNFE